MRCGDQGLAYYMRTTEKKRLGLYSQDTLTSLGAIRERRGVPKPSKCYSELEGKRDVRRSGREMSAFKVCHFDRRDACWQLIRSGDSPVPRPKRLEAKGKWGETRWHIQKRR